MKLRYPAEAFAFGIVLFSAGMKEAFAAGILVILSVVFAEFLKNLLQAFVPDWSLKLCVFIGTGAVSASAFLLAFSYLGTSVRRTFLGMCHCMGILDTFKHCQRILWFRNDFRQYDFRNRNAV